MRLSDEVCIIMHIVAGFAAVSSWTGNRQVSNPSAVSLDAARPTVKAAALEERCWLSLGAAVMSRGGGGVCDTGSPLERHVFPWLKKRSVRNVCR